MNFPDHVGWYSYEGDRMYWDGEIWISSSTKRVPDGPLSQWPPAESETEALPAHQSSAPTRSDIVRTRRPAKPPRGNFQSFLFGGIATGLVGGVLGAILLSQGKSAGVLILVFAAVASQCLVMVGVIAKGIEIGMQAHYEYESKMADYEQLLNDYQGLPGNRVPSLPRDAESSLTEAPTAVTNPS